MSVDHLRAKLSGSGPALFFPDPEVPAIFNFDQGLAAPETFPTEDLVRLARKALDEHGAKVLDYFDPATGYEELVFGFKGLRKEIADRTEPEVRMTPSVPSCLPWVRSMRSAISLRRPLKPKTSSS